MPRFHLPDLPKLAATAAVAAVVATTAAPASAAGPIRRLLGRNNDRAPRQYDAPPPVVEQPPVIIVEDQVPDVPNYAPRTTAPRRQRQGTREFSDSDTGYHRFGRSVVQRRGADSWDRAPGYDRYPNDGYQADRYPDRSFSRRSTTTTRDYVDRGAPIRSDLRSSTRSSAAQAGYYEEDRGVDRASTRRDTFRDDDRAVRDQPFDERYDLDRADRPAATADRDAAEPRFRDRPVRSRDARDEEPADSFSERDDRGGPDLLPPVPPED